MRLDIRIRLLLVFPAAALVAWLATAVQPVRAQAQAPARGVVTIAHFNDVYEIGPVQGGRAGGLARVATIVARLKRTAPPLLVTLGGDYLSPSALGTAKVNGEALAGRQMVDVLNATGLEWATLGNHEFDVPEAAFRARMSESKFSVVVSNVTDARGQLLPGTVRSAVVPLGAAGGTIRIGLIGVIVDANQKPWVRYLPPIAAARSAAGELRGRVDAIVALTHLSLAGDAELAEAVPELDLILGGHEHENWMLRRGEHFTPIIKADANVRSLAIVSMVFGARGARPAVSARLEIVDERVKPLASVDAIVRRWIQTAFDAFRKDGFSPDATVVTLNEALDGREATVRSRPGRLTEIIANAVRHEAKADIGVFNAGSVRIDDVLPPGPVTEYDIIRVLPFGGKILRASFDGALLARVLDAGLGNQGNGGYLHTSAGAIRTSGGWVVDGVPVDPTRRYVVGISDFLLTGGETNLSFLTRASAGIRDIEERRDVRLAVIDELRQVYR
jgi:5'-nucleotidase / UDP-sugar diphosphatase